VAHAHEAGKVRVILCFNRKKALGESEVTCAAWSAPPTTI